MKTFAIKYYEGAVGSISFEAESLEEANALLDKVRDGEIDVEDLRSYNKKERDYSLDIDLLEEVK